MRLRKWVRISFQLNIIFCFTLLLISVETAFSQAPALNPDQTVNTATGEMGFSLPLGTVKGINGKDFPITVNYKAGIPLEQEASPVGLGFSYGAGYITRRVVHIPDDNTGGDSCFFMTKNDNFKCDTPWWYVFYKIILFVIGAALAVLSIYCPYTGFAAGAVFAVASSITSAVIFAPSDYKAGGTHLKAYEPIELSDDSLSYGKGFFNEGYHHRDLPDIYFVNTPFMQGELAWCGSYNNSDGGYFVFRNTQGSSDKEMRTIKVDYSISNETFLITLSDGTRLFFEETKCGNSCSKSYCQIWGDKKKNVDCKVDNTTIQFQRVPEQWFLTKVLFPDYLGDIDPLSEPENAKGTWIVFEYDRRMIDNCRPLPKTFQVNPFTSVMSTPGYNPTDANTSIYEEVVLERIITPDQKAQYFYTPNRLDNLWFDIDCMEWFAPARNQMPAEKRVKRKTGSGTPYIQGKVLDSINIYSKNDEVLSRIKFNTGYSLKPGSFHSYTKDTFGNFDTVPGNPDAACLTLKSVEVIDKYGVERYQVTFKYNEDKDITAWDPNQIGNFIDLPDPMRFYVERKDYWGYFLYNKKNYNDFNRKGKEIRYPFSTAMWSMNEIEFSTGLKISWDYDLNRYDAANNLPVMGYNDSKVKYGGGIRVRTMTIDDGAGENIKRSYFYTDQVGVFKENDKNSSGHATVEPYTYLEAEDNLRNDTAKGGHYTACKVMYEMVQVVDNFKYGTEYPAPNGYTVYEYITPADHSPTEPFMNEGQYGEIDNSWKRGFLKRKRVYDRLDNLINDEMAEYEFIKQNKVDLSILSILDSMEYYLYEQCYGWVKQKRKVVTSMDVTTETNYLYSDQLEDTTLNESFTKTEIEFYDIDTVEGINFLPNHSNRIRPLTCRTKSLKGTDPDKYDYILAISDNAWVNMGEGYDPRNNIYVSACKDVDDSSSNQVRNGQWSKWNHINLPNCYYYINLLGIDIMDIDESGDDDLILVFSQDYNMHDLERYVYVIVCHNIEFNNDTLKWDSYPSYTQVELKDEDADFLKHPLRRYYSYPDGCVIGDFYGSSKPDFLIFTNAQNVGSDIGLFPGDIGKIQPEPHGRYILALIDFEESDGYVPDAYQVNSDMDMYIDTVPYLFYGITGLFKSVDSDSIKNDLIIAGPGKISDVSSIASNQVRFVYYQVFKDISFNDDNKLLSFSSPCHNCNKDSSILFNARPRYDDVWFTVKCAGFFEEDNKKSLVLYRERSSDQKLQIIDWISGLTCPGDYDGVPNRTYVRHIDSSYLLSEISPAYLKYNTMLDTHILSQKCGSSEYNFQPDTPDSVFTGNLSIYSDRVVNSKATTWDKINGVFVPKANYIWNVTMNSSGLPDTNYTPFDYTNGASNPDWLLTDSITEYTKHSQLKESVKPLNSSYNVYSAVNYGHNDKLPVASLKNAKFKESGVLTCDYNDNDENFYIDKNNGWELGNVCPGDSLPPTVELDKSIKHFGNASMHVVNAFGPSRNFKLTKYCDYIMSAWVNVISDTVYMTGDFRYIEKTNDTIWPVHPSALNTVMGVSFNGIKQGPTGGKWVLLKLKIPADSLLGSKNFEDNNWYARMFVGPYKGGEVYIDDIRFYPEKAMVTSSYYDSLWHQPILSIDENNKPGLRISYDGFGRPILWEKINPQFSVGETGFAVTVKEKDYFTKYDGICIISPKEKDYYAVSHPLEIKWRNDNERDVEIFYSIATDSPWVSLGTVNAISGKKEYDLTWNIPLDQTLSESYRIKVVDVAKPDKVFDKTMEFTIAGAKIFYPEEDDILLAGMYTEIRYFMAGDTTVDVTISINGTPIDTVPNTGSYKWYVPYDALPSDSFIIRIEANGITDESGPIAVINNSFIRKYQYDLLNPQWN